MRIEIMTTPIYVSDDGKKKSHFPSEIEAYESMQLKEIFERRTTVANISASTTLYLFKKGDIKTFKEFHPEAYLDSISEDEEGYFVYAYDSYHLYQKRCYETMILERIEHDKNILDKITDSIMVRENFQ